MLQLVAMTSNGVARTLYKHHPKGGCWMENTSSGRSIPVPFTLWALVICRRTERQRTERSTSVEDGSGQLEPSELVDGTLAG